MQNIYDLQTTVPRYVTLYGPHGQVTLSNKEQALQRFTLTGLDGFYGGAGVHVEDTQRQLGHGSFAAPTWRTGRFMTLRGTFTFTNDRDRTMAARWLSALYWDGKLGELTADYDGLELTARVRLDGAPSIVEQGVNILKVEIPLFAPDPFLYAAPRLYQIYPAGAGQGLVFPLFSTKMAGTPDPATVIGLPTVLGTGVTEDSASNPAPDGGRVAKITATTSSLFFGSWGGADIPATLHNKMCRLRLWLFSPTGESVTIHVRHNNSDRALVTNQEVTAKSKAGAWTPTDIWVRPTSTTTSITFTAAGLTATADNPIWVGGALATGGSISPVLDWGAGAPMGGAFANAGNSDAHPTYTVHGSWPAGFRITTGSKVIEYPSPVVPGHPVVIDHKTGSVTVSGVDQTYRLTRRDWVAVPPGEAIQPNIEPLAPSTGWCDINISDTFV